MYVEAKREEPDGEAGGRDEADGELDGDWEGEDERLSDMTKRMVATIARFDSNQNFSPPPSFLFSFSLFEFTT
jgi:hypothetical protein